MHTEGHLDIQIGLAAPGWELVGLTVPLPEAVVSDLSVAVLEAEDSREGEGVEDFREEAAGDSLVEGAMGIDKEILMMEERGDIIDIMVTNITLIMTIDITESAGLTDTKRKSLKNFKIPPRLTSFFHQRSDPNFYVG